ncbi:MAG: hypothetical protein H6555_08640 [Lewinellaceae bacterium]|nr:hypothetical protein [Lewinellaceae bacterium]
MNIDPARGELHPLFYSLVTIVLMKKRNKTMKRLILFLLCCCIYISIQAQTYSTINALNSGQWSNPSNWDINGVPPEPIPPGATVNINHWISIYSGTVTNNGTINVNAGQRLYNLATLTNNNLINVSGILIPSTGSTATNNSQGATINILNSGSMQTDSDVNVIFNNDGTFNNAGFVLNSIRLTITLPGLSTTTARLLGALPITRSSIILEPLIIMAQVAWVSLSFMGRGQLMLRPTPGIFIPLRVPSIQP